MKYRVTLSDRKNRRTVEAASSQGAVMLAVGARCYSVDRDYGLMPDGVEAWSVGTAVMMRNGTFTPVREIRAYVEALAD